MSGLQVDRLSVTVDGRPLVSDVTFRAAAGQITCLVGPNGAGKSTLVKALAGILPSVGSVHLEGIQTGSMTPRKRAITVGYVPQRTGVVLPFTSLEVVAHGLYAETGNDWVSPPRYRERALEIITELGMARFAERVFNKLSGGEQQLILLARALVGRPRLLLLDEPASALDIRHRLDLDARLRRLAQEGLTILIVLHDLTHVLELAQTVILLDKGRIAAYGPVHETLHGAAFQSVFGVKLLPAAGPGFRRASAISQ